ncbi:tripartite tricarboxylate transporter TctB family protein [Mesorhizobium sp. YR577]|uniref:tripartite tricarboxylate transporter TctB family protein n=1 Tax=Mesorhizobium sp. YR577 TaxID=1884373 RepID=UPI0008EDC336|nr:tripartite tricarboxylate transporter TctB family protein [Mesorhizobium sp. YR577]SFU19067.1 Molydopterin dinucleotide binding domain-containing protein [Mesorhizobium sp. YR577]
MNEAPDTFDNLSESPEPSHRSRFVGTHWGVYEHDNKRDQLEPFRAILLTSPPSTPSGRVELASEVAAGFGYPARLTPRECLGTSPAESFPLQFSPASRAEKLHSQWDRAAPSRLTKAQGRRPDRMRPEDAVERGIAEGDAVEITSPRGAYLAIAAITEVAMPSVAYAGSWHIPPGTGAEPNACLVDIKRFEGTAPAVRVYRPMIVAADSPNRTKRIQSKNRGETMSQRLNAETLAGSLFILTGGAFLLGSFELPFGTFRKIGPAGFPAVVAIGLIATGMIVFFQSFRATASREAVHFHPSKLGVIVLSIIVFGVTVRGAGLLVSVALCSLTAASASRPFRPLQMALYGLFLGALCSVAFVKGLGMPVPVIGPWFGF